MIDAVLTLDVCIDIGYTVSSCYLLYEWLVCAIGFTIWNTPSDPKYVKCINSNETSTQYVILIELLCRPNSDLILETIIEFVASEYLLQACLYLTLIFFSLLLLNVQ